MSVEMASLSEAALVEPGRPTQDWPDKRAPTSYDAGLGRRILNRRVALRMSRASLSAMIGVSTVQLHRYEVGKTRISAGRLIAIARALDASVESLASRLEGLEPGHVRRLERGMAELPKLRDLDEDSLVAPPRPTKDWSGKRSPTSDDVDVGRRICDRRVALGMSRAVLAATIGVSMPQLHRYEIGKTRVAASRLIAIARALGVSVESLVSETAAPEPGDVGPAARNVPTLPELRKLLDAFGCVPGDTHRRAITDFATAIALVHENGSNGVSQLVGAVASLISVALAGVEADSGMTKLDHDEMVGATKMLMAFVGIPSAEIRLALLRLVQAMAVRPTE